MNRIWRICGGAVWVAFFLLGSSPASAQVVVSVGGNVSDPSGSAIQNATVHLISVGTNVDRTTTTDQRGNYTYPEVVPGTYRLRVEAPGFEPYEQDDIHLQGNAATTLDVKLKVSQVQQNVRVTAQPGDQCIAPRGRILPDVGPGLRAIRSDPSGNYYVLSAPGASAAIYSPSGKRIGQVPAGSSPATSSTPPPAASPGSPIVSGVDLQVDSDGRVYIADFAANAIKIYSADGTLARVIRVPAPVSVEPLPGGEVAVAGLSSKHLVDVYDEERGELYRSFGDADEPIVVQCDSSTLICTEPVKDERPTATANRVWFYGDSGGNIYVSLKDSSDPTIRKYDSYGYVAYESALPLSRLAFGSGNSSWSLTADLRPLSARRLDTAGVGSLSSTSTGASPGDTTTSNANTRIAGVGPVGATQDGLRLKQKVAGPLASKPAIEAIGVDPASQEIWASIAGNLVHFDKDGQLAGYYCLSAVDQAPVKASTILVERNRILVGSDPFGIFEYARPDK